MVWGKRYNTTCRYFALSPFLGRPGAPGGRVVLVTDGFQMTGQPRLVLRVLQRGQLLLMGFEIAGVCGAWRQGPLPFMRPPHV